MLKIILRFTLNYQIVTQYVTRWLNILLSSHDYKSIACWNRPKQDYIYFNDERGHSSISKQVLCLHMDPYTIALHLRLRICVIRPAFYTSLAIWDVTLFTSPLAVHIGRTTMFLKCSIASGLTIEGEKKEAQPKLNQFQT